MSVSSAAMCRASFIFYFVLFPSITKILAISGLVLLFCGAFIAPQGEIHESLLVGFGFSFPFSRSEGKGRHA